MKTSPSWKVERYRSQEVYNRGCVPARDFHFCPGTCTAPEGNNVSQGGNSRSRFRPHILWPRLAGFVATPEFLNRAVERSAGANRGEVARLYRSGSARRP